ncbi:nucleolar protein 10 [Prorops nasuta]|uniref:nucleolar protein 10 n=1 Tax=Prorops nasuta TaxID=863751 RepID=UPI0034CEEB1B
MQVSCPNNVKIYNLSAGKSLPEWLSERKRRTLLKKNVDIRRRIELIQDFDMPAISTSIRATRDGQYILCTGIYKPRVKCFDVNNVSLKFERCFDSEVITFEALSDDYSKLVFLHCDRNVEFHVAHGKHYRLRIPRFGSDMQYHYPSCDLFIVGDSNEIYRINLERGQFLQSFTSEASSINKCIINPVHHLLTVGTQEGKIEAWDPRMKNKVGTLDCAIHCLSVDNKLENVASISALKFNGGLTLGVGTITGHILLYDIRTNKPFLVKDHMYGLPIKNIEFHQSMEYVYSMDSSIVKIWEKGSGKLYTSIEAQAEFNDLCVIPNTGMLMMANETTKMQTYYIPSLGPAPYWCGYLDNLTEELEESNYETIYDDYKFVTEKELEELDLAHLKGTNLLRAYMHGYFIDIRLYKKARDVIKPFEFEEYKKKKIQQIIKENESSLIKVQKLPSVNKELALKLIDNEMNENKKKKKKTGANLLKDDRFTALFTNPDFQVDKNSEEFSLLNPVISQLDKSRAKKLKLQLEAAAKEESQRQSDNDANEEFSSDEDLIRDDSSSDDGDKAWAKEVKKQYRKIKRNERESDLLEKEDKSDEIKTNGTSQQLRFLEMSEGTELKQAKPVKRKRERAPLGERLEREDHTVRVLGTGGNREMTFVVGKKKRVDSGKDGVNRHRKEYKHLLRPAGNLRKFKH